jgi:hypothetical protein
MDWGGRIHRVWTFCGEAARFQRYSGLLPNGPMVPNYDFPRTSHDRKRFEYGRRTPARNLQLGFDGDRKVKAISLASHSFRLAYRGPSALGGAGGIRPACYWIV